MVVLHNRIYRGEVRGAIPTYEHPDPAAHAAEDPEGFLKKWMEPQYPYPKGWSGGNGLTVGQHWTRSPQVIPERFAVPLHPFGDPQPGVPMSKREQTAISRREFASTEHDTVPHYPNYPDVSHPGYDASDEEREAWRRIMDEHQAKVEATSRAIEEHHATGRKYATYAERAEREGVNTYHDLSGGDPNRPGKARRYNMAVIWEGQPHESAAPATQHEDEFDIPFGEHVTVTGARIYVPKSGAAHDFTGRHPSTFTGRERAEANSDPLNTFGIHMIDSGSHVPWSRVQFANAQQLKVARVGRPNEGDR